MSYRKFLLLLIGLLVCVGVVFSSKIRSAYIEFRLNQVGIAWSEGRMLDAIEQLDSFSSKHPEVSRYPLAEMYAQLYDQEKVKNPILASKYKARTVEILQQFMNKRPKHGMLLYAVGKLYEEHLGETKVALELYKRSEKSLKDDLIAIKEGRILSGGYQIGEQDAEQGLKKHQNALEDTRARISRLSQSER